MAVRLGELLLREKRISPAQLQEALSHQRAQGGRLGSALVRLGFVRDEDITGILSRQYGVPAISLGAFDLDPAVVRMVPLETALKYQVIAVARSGPTLTLAMTDPTNVFAMDDIKFMTGFNVEPVVASESAIREAIDKFYSQAQGDALQKVMEEFGDGEEVPLARVMQPNGKYTRQHPAKAEARFDIQQFLMENAP